jgi:hypothetical protein
MGSLSVRHREEKNDEAIQKSWIAAPGSALLAMTGERSRKGFP